MSTERVSQQTDEEFTARMNLIFDLAEARTQETLRRFSQATHIEYSKHGIEYNDPFLQMIREEWGI